jgi:hypothetical protein
MRVRRSTAAVSGLLITLLGLWGALIAFVGPYFHYAFGVNEAWHYTTDRLWLNILPGATAMLGGTLLAFSARRGALIAGALLSLLAGAWFVVGPAVSLTWETGAGPIGRPLFGSTTQMLELVGYFYGLGALIAVFAAYSLGRVSTAAVSAVGAPGAEVLSAAPEPLAAEPEPAAPAHTHRGGLLSHRRLRRALRQHRAPQQGQPR